MLRVGLTGGLGSGKSFIGRALAELGCYVIQADELGHQVLLPGGAAYKPVVEVFGSGILDAQGLIDRRKLAALVFNDPAKLAQLSAVVHPAVAELEESAFAQIAETVPHAIAVVEAAILVETGSYKRFDRLILAACTPEQQIERAMHRHGCTEQEARARIARQLPLEEKKRVADYVIDTSGSKERTLEQVRDIYHRLRSLEQ